MSYEALCESIEGEIQKGLRFQEELRHHNPSHELVGLITLGKKATGQQYIFTQEFYQRYLGAKDKVEFRKKATDIPIWKLGLKATEKYISDLVIAIKQIEREIDQAWNPSSRVLLYDERFTHRFKPSRTKA